MTRLTCSIKTKRHLVKSLLFTLFLTSYYYFHITYVTLPPTHMRHFVNKHVTEQYNGFDFERENWTVRMREADLKDESKQKLFELQNKEHVVKRIIHVNGTIENLGCSNITLRCNNVMQFDSKHNVRMNTPPCCRKALLTLLRHFTQEFRKYGVDHYLGFGGVIGWYRYRDIIPYDLDLDLLVDERFWYTDLMKHIIKKMRDLYGHDTDVQMNGRKLWVAYSKINRNHIDIWPFTKTIRQNKLVVSIPRDTHANDQLYSTMFPLKDSVFGDIPIYVPNDPLAYLNELYGKGNWEEEVSCQHIINGKCYEYHSTIYRLFGIY